MPGAAATARQAAWAKRLELPTTKAEKVKLGLSRATLEPVVCASRLSESVDGSSSGSGDGSSGGGVDAGSTVMITSHSCAVSSESVSRITGEYRSISQSRASRVGTPMVNVRPSGQSRRTALRSQVS